VKYFIILHAIMKYYIDFNTHFNNTLLYSCEIFIFY
jgi:hypothetical protein